MLKTVNSPAKINFGGGAKFWAYISGQNETPEILTKWSIKLEHTTSNWTGSITSDNPDIILETPNLSGIFKVYVQAAGTTFKETSLDFFDYSEPDVGCNDNCISMIGICITKEDEKIAKYWTVWNALQSE